MLGHGRTITKIYSTLHTIFSKKCGGLGDRDKNITTHYGLFTHHMSLSHHPLLILHITHMHSVSREIHVQQQCGSDMIS